MDANKVEQEPLLKPEPVFIEATKDGKPQPEAGPERIDVGVPVDGPATHDWESHLCCWFGKCNVPGVSSCLLTYFVPCLAWGWNMRRAFKHSMLLHATLYFLLLMGSGYVLMGANRAEDAMCPHGIADEASAFAHIAHKAAGPPDGGRRLLAVHRRLAEAGIEVSGADQAAAAAAMFEETDAAAEFDDEEDSQAALWEPVDMEEEDDEEEERKHRGHKKHREEEEDDDDEEDEEDEEEEHDHHKEHHEEHHGHHKEGKKKGHHGCHKHDKGPPHPRPPPPEPTPWDELPKECRRAIVNKQAWLGWAVLCSLLGIAYCAAHRTQLRAKFGIAGSRMGDFCTWCWCGPCALCQETRTLWTNNVHEGVWYGPAQPTLPLTTPPPAQAVTGTPVPKTV